MAEYKEILSDLKRKRENLVAQIVKLNTVISGLEEFASENATIAPVKVARVSYRGKTMLDAAYKCLELHHNEPMTSREIAEDLMAGGFKSKSKKFHRLLYNVLYKDDRFESTGGKWSLEEHTYVVNWGTSAESRSTVGAKRDEGP